MHILHRILSSLSTYSLRPQFLTFAPTESDLSVSLFMSVAMGSRGQGRSNAIRCVALLLCVMAMADCTLAGLVTVGGGKGWILGFNYKVWSTRANIRTNDNILFKYDARDHNVLMVSKANYDSCKTSNPLAKYSSGKDRLKFTKPGVYYFICGVPNHCSQGMKVALKVK